MTHLMIEVIALRVALHKVAKSGGGRPASLSEWRAELEGHRGEDKDRTVEQGGVLHPLTREVGLGGGVIVEVDIRLGVVPWEPDGWCDINEG